MNQQEINRLQEYIVFTVANTFCGLNIKDVQEIKRITDITTVHHAPPYVQGVINLRGQIVTVIDLCKKFNYTANELNISKRIVIVKHEGEYIGLLVDAIEDAVTAAPEDILPPPSNVNQIEGRYFTGVYKLDNALVAILNKNRILEPDSVNEQTESSQTLK